MASVLGVTGLVAVTHASVGHGSSAIAPIKTMPDMAGSESVVVVSPWNRPALASSQWESHPAIDPSTGDIWLVRSDKNFAGWRLMIARCAGGTLARPEPAPIAGAGLEADPGFSRDGRTLWFISSRASGAFESKALDIYRVHRSAAGRWGEPERLPSPVNSDEAEWFPRPAPDGWLYFGSRRSGGFGNDDIWRARQTRDGRWQVENAGPRLNTAGAEYEFEPSPDGRWGILSTSEGLFMISHVRGAWQRRYRFDASVNANGSEIGPMIARDGQSFLFSRDLGDDHSGEIMKARLTSRAIAPSGVVTDHRQCAPTNQRER